MGCVAGLSPHLHGLTNGRLPREAIVGRNGFGKRDYSICPAKGSTEHYLVVLDALSKRIPVKPGFDGGVLFEQILPKEIPEGRLFLSYSRP